MPFGKYKDKPLPDLPDSYVEWLLDQPWVTGNLRISLEHRIQGADFSVYVRQPVEPVQNYRGSIGNFSEKARHQSSRMRSNI